MKVSLTYICRSAVAGTVAVALLGAAACSGGSQGPAAEPVAAESAAPSVTVTDIVGRTVSVPAPAERVALGEGRLLYLTALLDKEDPLRGIVAWPDDLKSADLDTYNAYREEFPEIEDIPELGGLSQGAFSTEAVIGLEPDVLVLSMSGYRAAEEIGAIEILDRVGVPTVVVDFRDHPLETTARSVEILGQILDREEQAREFVSYYTEQIDMVRARVAASEQEKPTTFIYRAAGLLECCGTFGDSNLGELVELAGGINLGSEFLPAESGTLAEEQLLTSDPDHIIVTGSNWTNSENKVPGVGYVSMGYRAEEDASREQLGALTDQPGWAALQAVTEDQFHALWHQFYGSPYNFVAAIQFAKWQHPEAFSDIDPTEIYRDFHERFLPVPYSGTFWMTL